VAPYANTGAQADDCSQRVGDHHDGMDIFYIDAHGRYTYRPMQRAVLVVNHESSADAHFFHPHGQTSNGVAGKKFSQFGDWDLGSRPEAEVLKEINHHGVSIVEVRFDERGGRRSRRSGKRGGDLRCAQLPHSPLNRRVTDRTLMRIAGPAEHLAQIREHMVTRHDPTGATSRGKLNNCGHGRTPWGNSPARRTGPSVSTCRPAPRRWTPRPLLRARAAGGYSHRGRVAGLVHGERGRPGRPVALRPLEHLGAGRALRGGLSQRAQHLRRRGRD
jgi:hypothetical protein